MPLTPRDRATVDHVQDLVLHVAKIVAAYREQLQRDGMSEGEAWELCVRLEERLLGPVFDRAEAELRPAPWADIEALFVACVNLQLVLGQALSAPDAVRYMKRAGVRVPALSHDQARQLAKRAPIPASDILLAFESARL